nr:hypothetical protein QOL21_03735 [Acholeplasma laidlawii]
MVKEVSAGAVVYTKVDDQYLFLMIQNKNGNHFSFPKGHVEKMNPLWIQQKEK